MVVLATGTIRATCISSAARSRTVTATVVPGVFFELEANASQTITSWFNVAGILENVPAGTHQVALRVQNADVGATFDAPDIRITALGIGA